MGKGFAEHLEACWMVEETVVSLGADFPRAPYQRAETARYCLFQNSGETVNLSLEIYISQGLF